MTKSILFIILLAIFIIQTPNTISADGHTVIDSGIIKLVETNSNEELVNLTILKNDGSEKTFGISKGEIPTEYGLENIAGERWIGNQNTSAKTIPLKLKEHQKRFAPITILSSGNIALEIVDMENRNVRTNLIYLFICFFIAWLAFFSYLFIINNRVKSIDNAKK